MSLTRGLVLDVANQSGGAMPSIVTLHDWSRFGNDGAMTNVTWAQLASTGLWYPVYNGTTSIVNCGTNVSLAITDAITIEAWVYAVTLGEGLAGRIVAKNDVADYAYLPISADNSIGIYFNSTQYKSNAGIFVLGTWQYFVVTFDRFLATNQIKHYKNGVAIGTNIRAAAIPTSANALSIGNRVATGRTFDGNLPLLRLYNYALSPAQIRARYHSTRWLFGSPT